MLDEGRHTVLTSSCPLEAGEGVLGDRSARARAWTIEYRRGVTSAVPSHLERSGASTCYERSYDRESCSWRERGEAGTPYLGECSSWGRWLLRGDPGRRQGQSGLTPPSKQIKLKVTKQTNSGKLNQKDFKLNKKFMQLQAIAIELWRMDQTEKCGPT